MRPLICLAHALLGLAFTLQGCGRNDAPTPPIKPGPTGTVATGPQVGLCAPEIAGDDIDGVPFKLSDYRGKVVLLDFWGDW